MLGFVLGVIAGTAFFVGWVAAVDSYGAPLYQMRRNVMDWLEGIGLSSMSSEIVFFGVPVSVVAVLVFWITDRTLLRRTRRESETRCRTCGYILRGLERPECSECGEKI